MTYASRDCVPCRGAIVFHSKFLISIYVGNNSQVRSKRSMQLRIVFVINEWMHAVQGIADGTSCAIQYDDDFVFCGVM